jgi:hypothetical protein
MGAGMNATELVTLIGVCVAAIGYFIRYRIDLKLEHRRDRLERINRQLSEFYGPLLALTRSSDESWQAFRKRYRPPWASHSGRAILLRHGKTPLPGGYG